MMHKIYESKRVRTVGAMNRLARLFGHGAKRTLLEWVNEYGDNNVSMAIEAGILSEVATPQSMVSSKGIMKDGDYIVFKGDGFILYHMADGKLWRTSAQAVKGLTLENARPVEGIDISDGNLPVVMYGHETAPKLKPGSLRQINADESPENQEI